ncbi:hypothetical protein LCGC14_2926860 [marine sediment metagenome]|uniref:Uncharacterized protein n=1 Tax=marine sediment metagenome TaxID=412755 RepID=A0A0F8XME5_9ZZZZ
MKVTLCREEELACIISLENNKRLGEWGKSALTKLLKERGLKPKLAPH